ncbi:hypothetical protein GCM10027160_09660 [Streptomyces calidiresistens]|nr:ATP-binding protein [Streptomyces calidiresistens]
MTENPPRTAHPAHTPCTLPTIDPGGPVRRVEARFASTPRGARLARRFAAEWLHARGVPEGSRAHDALILVVAELTANAVRHGCVPGRDFALGLALDPDTARIEVTDTRGDRLPRVPRGLPGPDRTGGRGLLLVARLADRWGWSRRPCGGPGKTVWAEYDAPGAAVESPEPGTASRP